MEYGVIFLSYTELDIRLEHWWRDEGVTGNFLLNQEVKHHNEHC